MPDILAYAVAGNASMRPSMLWECHYKGAHKPSSWYCRGGNAASSSASSWVLQSSAQTGSCTKNCFSQLPFQLYGRCKRRSITTYTYTQIFQGSQSNHVFLDLVIAEHKIFAARTCTTIQTVCQQRVACEQCIWVNSYHTVRLQSSCHRIF